MASCNWNGTGQQRSLTYNFLHCSAMECNGQQQTAKDLHNKGSMQWCLPYMKLIIQSLMKSKQSFTLIPNHFNNWFELARTIPQRQTAPPCLQTLQLSQYMLKSMIPSWEHEMHAKYVTQGICWWFCYLRSSNTYIFVAKSRGTPYYNSDEVLQHEEVAWTTSALSAQTVPVQITQHPHSMFTNNALVCASLFRAFARHKQLLLVAPPAALILIGPWRSYSFPAIDAL